MTDNKEKPPQTVETVQGGFELITEADIRELESLRGPDRVERWFGLRTAAREAFKNYISALNPQDPVFGGKTEAARNDLKATEQRLQSLLLTQELLTVEAIEGWLAYVQEERESPILTPDRIAEVYETIRTGELGVYVAGNLFPLQESLIGNEHDDHYQVQEWKKLYAEYQALGEGDEFLDARQQLVRKMDTTAVNNQPPFPRGDDIVDEFRRRNPQVVAMSNEHQITEESVVLKCLEIYLRLSRELYRFEQVNVYNAGELDETLRARGVDVEGFNSRSTKKVQDLEQELLDGECQLSVNSAGEMMRQVNSAMLEVYIVDLSLNKRYLLIEDRQEFHDGSGEVRRRNFNLARIPLT